MPRLALLGIGNELDGDDGAGVALARRVLRLAGGCPRLLVLEAGPAPESFSGVLRRFQPDFVLWADAAQMNLAPGEVRYLQVEELDGVSATSHTLPPSVLAKFLRSDLQCDMGVLGIQPLGLEMGAPLSEPVRRAVMRAGRRLAQIILEADSGSRA